MRFKEERQTGCDIANATENTMVTSGKAIIYDVISNIIGFIVFIFSGFIPLQNFGWLISFTMLTVAIGSLLVFPAAISYLNPKFLQFDKVDKNNAPLQKQNKKELEPVMAELAEV